MKNIKDYIPFRFVICLISGITVQIYLKIPVEVLIGLNLFVFLIFCFLFFRCQLLSKGIKTFSIVGLLCAICIGINLEFVKNERNDSHHYMHKNSMDEQVEHQLELKINKVLKATNYYHRYEGVVKMINGLSSNGKVIVRVRIDSFPKPYDVDDILLLKAQLNEILPPKFDQSFNYRAYLENRQIFHQITSTSEMIFRVKPKLSTIKGYAYKFRKTLQNSLNDSSMNIASKAFLLAMLLGERSALSKEVSEQFAKAGVIHMLAVSGLHIGILVLILNIALWPLNRIRKGALMRMILVVIFLWLYALFIGLTASVVRAVTMFTCLSIGWGLKRKSNVYQNLIISVFILMLIRPRYLMEVGFQLSYVAVFSIVYLQPKIAKLWRPNLYVLKKIWQLSTVSIAAQIGVLPLSMFYFHQFPGLFLLSNIVVIPFLGMLLMFGILVLILIYFEINAITILKLYEFLINKMQGFVEWVASKEMFIFDQISFSFYTLIGAYIGYFFVFYFMYSRKVKHLYYVLFIGIIISSTMIFKKKTVAESDELIVFHSADKSLIVERRGSTVFVPIHLDSLNKIFDFKQYTLGLPKVKIKEREFKHPFYKVAGNLVLVIDSLGAYSYNSIKPDILILKESPDVNLHRVLDHLRPELVIADGSNYFSDMLLWEATCIQNKTPFYNTWKEGAFILKSD